MHGAQPEPMPRPTRLRAAGWEHTLAPFAFLLSGRLTHPTDLPTYPIYLPTQITSQNRQITSLNPQITSLNPNIDFDTDI